MAVIEIFPRAIGKYRLDDERTQRLKDQCLTLLQQLDSDDKVKKINVDNSALAHYFNRDNMNLLDLPEFKWFEEWITEKSLDYVENVLGYELKGEMIVTDCWLNKCDAGGEQFNHTHANAYVSGTYYVNFIKGLHAPIGFKNKDFNPENSVMQTIDIPIKYPTKYNTWGAHVDYGEGDLLLWQSNISHGYIDNKEDNRISISFNVMPRYIYNHSYSFRIERQ